MNAALSCASEILAGGCRLVDDEGKEVDLPQSIKEVFLFSLVSEHYASKAARLYRASDS
jgi:hypothetical protein